MIKIKFLLFLLTIFYPIASIPKLQFTNNSTISFSQMTKNNENTSHNKEKNKNNQTYHMLSFQVLNSNLVKTKNIEIHQKNIVTFNISPNVDGKNIDVYCQYIFKTHIVTISTLYPPPPPKWATSTSAEGRKKTSSPVS